MRHVYTAAEPCQDLARKYTAGEWQKSELFAARDAPEGTAYRSCRRLAGPVWPRRMRSRPAIFFSLRNHSRFRRIVLDIGGNALPLFLASDPVVVRFPLPEQLTGSSQHPVGL